MTDPTLGARLSQCAREFAVAAAGALTTSEGLNIPSAIAGCARLGGTCLFRTFALAPISAEPGTPVLSAEAEQATAMLIRVCAGALHDLGREAPERPPAGWDEERNRPRLGFLETNRALEPVLAPMRARHGLDAREAGIAAAIAAAILVNGFAEHFDPGLGFAVAVFGFTEGTRTLPDPEPLAN